VVLLLLLALRSVGSTITTTTTTTALRHRPPPHPTRTCPLPQSVRVRAQATQTRRRKQPYPTSHYSYGNPSPHPHSPHPTRHPVAASANVVELTKPNIEFGSLPIRAVRVRKTDVLRQTFSSHLRACRLRGEDEDGCSDSGETGGIGSTVGNGGQRWAGEALGRLSSEVAFDSRAKIMRWGCGVLDLQGAR